MKTDNKFIAAQCDQAGEVCELETPVQPIPSAHKLVPIEPRHGGAPKEFWELLHEWADCQDNERLDEITHRFNELFLLAVAPQPPNPGHQTTTNQ